MPKQLTPEQYQQFKKKRQAIQLDRRTSIQNMELPSFFPSRDEYYDKIQEEAQFAEARMQALRSSFGLPRKVDYFQSHPSQRRKKGVK